MTYVCTADLISKGSMTLYKLMLNYISTINIGNSKKLLLELNTQWWEAKER